MSESAGMLIVAFVAGGIACAILYEGRDALRARRYRKQWQSLMTHKGGA